MNRVRPINIAILAMGGEGGGVLADWLLYVAEENGYLAQVTSVPGVAQRTGATIYYLELFARSAAAEAGKPPILGLMPVAGDVDLVVASELMEAGRAVQRGFVTPERTHLIASTHRVYSIGERMAVRDGRVDQMAILDGCKAAAKEFIGFDMAALRQEFRSLSQPHRMQAPRKSLAKQEETYGFNSISCRASSCSRSYGELKPQDNRHC
ncbi:hypothetical protein [Bradyrhizobium genosp. P]|uniref:hypothetical protein n=1 Tax=Bradyrhizobium genosp. P TaxID=83641 RepID=UPI003CF6AB6B